MKNFMERSFQMETSAVAGRKHKIEIQYCLLEDTLSDILGEYRFSEVFSTLENTAERGERDFYFLAITAGKYVFVPELCAGFNKKTRKWEMLNTGGSIPEYWLWNVVVDRRICSPYYTYYSLKYNPIYTWWKHMMTS